MSAQPSLFNSEASHVLSPCERYRYSLEWNAGNPRCVSVLWLCINPSTALAVNGEIDHDQTTRKITAFSRRNAFGRVLLANLFAWRAKDILECKAACARGEAIGELNDDMIAGLARSASSVVLAFGPKPWAYPRARKIIDLLGEHARTTPIMCLGYSKDGAPLHPLTLGYDAHPLVPFDPRRMP